MVVHGAPGPAAPTREDLAPLTLMEVPVDDAPRLETVVPEARTVDLTDPHLSIPAGVTAVRITTADMPDGAVTGTWLDGADLSGSFDGDVIAAIGTCQEHDQTREGLHLTLHLVHDERILPLGSWCEVGIADLAETLRAPASTAMVLHGELEEAGMECGAYLPAD
ncbi:MAG TPA: hypothetical protein VGX23_18640 [Actinocrinis sp.]|nr:hypothetical protein [Actinocrinis sp.]